MLVDAFMADRLLAVAAHHTSDLLRAQVILQISLYLRLHHRSELDPAATGETPIFCLPLCLFVAVAALPTVAPDLPADRAGISTQALGYTSLSISLFRHPLDRVSFFLS